MNFRKAIFCTEIIAFSLGVLVLVAACTSVSSSAGALPAESVKGAAAEGLRVYPALWYGDARAACSLTFDDGTLDQFLTAAPELESRGITGTFFVITALVKEGVWQDGDVTHRLFSWDQARQLALHGHEIASHTAHHRDLSANPGIAVRELTESYLDLRREIPSERVFSLGWPYWRSTRETEEAAGWFYYAARAGGVSAHSGDIDYGGVNGPDPADFFRIGARGILTSDTKEDLKSVMDEVYGNRGWLVPNFHGVSDGSLDAESLGWEALPINTFRQILDTLAARDFWFAPFGEVARYVRQRDALSLKVSKRKNGWRVVYATELDPGLYNEPLTLVIELPGTTVLKEVVSGNPGHRLAVVPGGTGGSNTCMVTLPPGSGELRLVVAQTR